MRFILRYLEIIFTFAGLAVIFLVTALVKPTGTSSWAVAAITATLVGVIHGLLFWVIRHRQRETRHKAIREMQAVLQDLVNNQLAVIQAMADLRQSRPEEAQRACHYISQAVTSISDSLKNIDDDRIKSWQLKYPKLTQAAN